MRRTGTTIENYLVTIYRFEEIRGWARTNDVSKELNIRPATVTKIVKKLAKSGLVIYNRYKGFRLSEKGREIAERIVWKHRVAERFLHDILGFDIYDSHFYAHEMEHLSDDIIKAIDRYLGSPRECPHGNPLPRRSPNSECVALKDVEGPGVYVVRAVRGELTSTMKLLRQLGITVGSLIHVLKVRKLAVEIKYKDRLARVESPDYESICVEPFEVM